MKKILIVEDETAIADALKVGLEEAGYEAQASYDGEDGLNNAKEMKPDLILLDIHQVSLLHCA